MDAIQLNLFNNRLSAICDEMGLSLRNAAFSPNIRDRLDYSCALFDAQGELVAQAAHIPVHLGSMAFAMADIVQQVDWQPGDQLILNDPYLGGTHLPDITLIAPFFFEDELIAFVVNRAHHADIGASTPGSMPISNHLDQEGLVIAPTHLYQAGQKQEAAWQIILNRLKQPQQGEGDLAAQISANQSGLCALQQWLQGMGRHDFQQGLIALNEYGHRLAQQALKSIPNGTYAFQDHMDDDGQGQKDIIIQVELRVQDGQIEVDFSGTAEQVTGNINCPLSVTAAGVYYVFRCLMPPQTPACAGIFRSIQIQAPEGCLLNARYPAAVAAGNVETSTRVVDVVLGALNQALPLAAASQGSMNNLAMGAADWDYYETLGGGMGAWSDSDGLDAVQTHMTNTLNTPIEVLEQHYPIRLLEYRLRRGSGGAGRHRGGDGLVRSFQFLSPAQISLITERRHHVPWGWAGGEAGQPGRNWLNDRPLPAKCQLAVAAGDVLRIETPGGGGYAQP